MKNPANFTGLIKKQMILGIFFILFGFIPISSANELEYDEYTILLLHFNDSVTDASGVSPTVATADEFEPGIFGLGLRLHRSNDPFQGDSLYFSVPEDYDPSEGTVEFWINPRWYEDDYIFMQAFNMHEVRLQVNTPGLLTFFMLNDEHEGGYQPVDYWTDNEWHHVAVTWKIPGRMRLYVDGFEKVNNYADSLDLIIGQPEIFKVGGNLPSNNMDAVFDEFRFSSVARSAEEIANSVLAADFEIYDISLDQNAIRLQPGTDFKPVLSADTDLGMEYFPNAAFHWTVEDTAIASVDEAGIFYGLNPGNTTFSAVYDTFQFSGTITVDGSIRRPDTLEVDEYLAALPDDFLWEKPVLVVEYIPLTDSLNVEPNSAGDAFTLEHMQPRMNVYNRRVKYMMQEGSRYHGYKDSTAKPSLGFRVVDRIRIYEHMPMSKKMCGWHPDYYYPDYHKVMERINAEHYVNDLGVKEIWIWYSGYEINGLGYELPESNMSSPTTGDISNSARDNTDLPVYDHTYILYQFDWALTHGYAVHNQGHQIESMMGYANQLQDGNEHLFFRKFCGMDSTDTWITGRCGWTHMAPNSDQHYHYTDTNHVWSDCEDWTPEKIGELKWVNVDTWRNLEYDWPDEPEGWTPEDSPYHINWARAEVNFYIYWRQNIPGRGAEIPYGEDKMITNWWQFPGDWDAAISTGPKLWEYTEPQKVDDRLVLQKFKLYSNYPNPFNNNTMVRYQLPAKLDVNFSIYDILGNKVFQHKKGWQEAGIYKFSWQTPDNLTSGIYFMEIQGENNAKQYRQVQKMILLK